MYKVHNYAVHQSSKVYIPFSYALEAGRSARELKEITYHLDIYFLPGAPPSKRQNVNN